jgi:hypothetical protein
VLYQRQKELLHIVNKLQHAGKTKLQKLEFLSCIDSAYPPYDFFPYNYGPYSMTMQNDLDYLCKEGLLSFVDEQYQNASDDVSFVNAGRLQVLDRTLNEYGMLEYQELMKLIYIRYPKYAVNSEVAEKLLSVDEFMQVRNCVPKSDSARIFTIGYEGKSLEKYLMQLFENGVSLLIDVRASSYSMKKEFIGSRLASGCNLLKIEYIHIPELGIPNQYRKDIPDKDSLFQFYQDELLSQHTKEIGQVVELLHQHRRIALTCFEALHIDCHRHYLAEELFNYVENKVPVVHL